MTIVKAKPLFSALFILLFALIALPAQAQDSTLPGTITLAVEAGYNGHYRELEWMPVQVQLANDGDDLSGRLVVRPETNGNGITATFSTPVTLARGARQTASFNVVARSFVTTLRVELLDDAGVVLATETANVRALQPMDWLYAVFSDSAVGAVDMTGARLGGAEAFQADWAVEQLPTTAAALSSVNVILFHDVNTATLSSAQRAALTDWVTAGGHLLVAGGANWQAVAAGLADLLPLQPNGSATVESLTPLAEWLTLPQEQAAALTAQTVMATGTLGEDARMLVAVDDLPLLARRTLGAGVVDYLAADPGTAPLRGWGRLADLWFTLQTNTGAQPGWSEGFSNWDEAARAAEIIPGVDTLPDTLPLLLFFLLYIVVIGPLNYLLLNRLDRREWAWLTIPACVILFSVAAYLLGFALRGNDVTLNRLAVIQRWPDSARAQIDAVIGVLSPRRAQYDLIAPDMVLQPVPRPLVVGSNLLARDVQTATTLVATENVAATGTIAEGFSVDASFVASFHGSGWTDAPLIGGSATLAYDEASGISGQQVMRGSVVNEGDIPLLRAVVLARGTAYALGDVAPGAVVPFTLTLPGEGASASSPYLPTGSSTFFNLRTAQTASTTEQSVFDIMGAALISQNNLFAAVDETTRMRLREQFLLNGWVDDSFGSTGRGDGAYVAGWLEDAPLSLALDGAPTQEQTNSLVLAALEVEHVATTETVTVSSDRFTWATQTYTGVGMLSPVNLSMQPGEEVVFRFTPLPNAVLNVVDSLTLGLDNLNVSSRLVPLSIWNWRAETWDVADVGREGYTIPDPDAYLGPENAVQLRFAADEIGGYLRIGRVMVEQRGRF